MIGWAFVFDKGHGLFSVFIQITFCLKMKLWMSLHVTSNKIMDLGHKLREGVGSIEQMLSNPPLKF